MSYTLRVCRSAASKTGGCRVRSWYFSGEWVPAPTASPKDQAEEAENNNTQKEAEQEHEDTSAV